jgi:DNA helicase-2/ATP-dependent DNA helicase PcrA
VTVTTPLDAAAKKAPGHPAAGGSGGGNVSYGAGDRVSHGKWGEGTVVSVKGTGQDMELQIAFPAPVGIKRLLASFAPITKL